MVSPKLPLMVGRASAWTARALPTATRAWSPKRSKGRDGGPPGAATSMTLGRAPKT